MGIQGYPRIYVSGSLPIREYSGIYTVLYIKNIYISKRQKILFGRGHKLNFLLVLQVSLLVNELGKKNYDFLI